MTMSPMERKLRSQHAALIRWSTPGATAEQGRKIRDAQLEKFEAEVDPTGALPPEERRRLAERRRSAHFADLARRSLKARRRGREEVGPDAA